jgi:oxygen-independent coproporphyrinogen-3 oxidase
VDVSLYFHIPFCTRKCAYCHFYVLPDKESLKQKLLHSLQQEWQLRLPLLQNNEAGVKKQIVSIYFGGGTPALFGPQAIGTLLDAIRLSPISLADSCEITLEANPENITPSLMRAYASRGINRVSIGLQTLDEALLPRLNRVHTAQEGINAVINTASSGISNISVDLMYELPEQTLFSWIQTLERTSTLPITHISLYNLTIEPATSFFRQRHTLQPLLPSQEVGASMYKAAIETLGVHGFPQYEISAFAKQNYFSRHNTGYWTGRPFLGFGPSAFSYWEGKRFRNVPHLDHYAAALAQGKIALDSEEELEKPAQQRELLAIHLRLLEGVDLHQFQQKNAPFEPITLQVIDTLKEQGLLQRYQGKLSLTEKGRMFYDSVATELI